uniref:Uncharacterized protein n=1 Tax=Solanum lycopersicum TaxID=4081 RepID=K4AVV0_SOLLC
MLHLTFEEIYEICFVKKGTLSQQNVEDQLNGKIFNIQMKKLFTKKLDAMQTLSILSYPEKEDVIHEPVASTKVNVTKEKKRTIEHVNSRDKEYPSIANKFNPPMKKNFKFKHFCYGCRSSQFLHFFAVATECQILQASDVSMWMSYVPVL